MLLVIDYKFIDLEPLYSKNILDFLYYAEFLLDKLKKENLKK